MKESPDGTKWKDNAVLYDYTKESKPVSQLQMAFAVLAKLKATL